MSFLSFSKRCFQQIKPSNNATNNNIFTTRSSLLFSISNNNIKKRAYSFQPPVVRPTSPNYNNYQRFRQSQEPFYKSKRLWITVGTGTVLFGGYYVTHLEKVPISGRTRFMDVSPRLEAEMAKQAYAETMAQFGNRILPRNHPYTRFVTRVAQRLIKVSGMENLNWEFHVIDSPERNAFVLPGGKIFVFTGILPIVENEDGMAAVLGHEISHQIARHSAEKLSFGKILLAFQLTLVLFGIDPSMIFNQFTLNFVMLKPFSRKCEKEADEMGLDIMAAACFNPREAIHVWRRMEEASAGKEIPQFASTHPSHQNRIVYLQERMPGALQRREMSNCSSEIQAFSDMFRQNRSIW